MTLDEQIAEQARKVVSFYQFGGLKGTAEALISLGDLAVLLEEKNISNDN